MKPSPLHLHVAPTVAGFVHLDLNHRDRIPYTDNRAKPRTVGIEGSYDF